MVYDIRKVIFATPLTLVTCYLLLVTSSFASTMNNNSLNLDVQLVTPTPTPIPPPQEKPKPTPVNAIGGNLIFGSDADFIDFGLFSPTNPILRTSTLTVIGPSLKGYEILSSEDHPLSSTTSATIEDTTCDNGLCKETNSASWNNTLTYGFGYRCDGGTCSPGFEDPSYFKQFANKRKQPVPQQISTDANSLKNTLRITYKVNVSGTTDLSVPYQNTITYILVPNL